MHWDSIFFLWVSNPHNAGFTIVNLNFPFSCMNVECRFNVVMITFRCTNPLLLIFKSGIHSGMGASHFLPLLLGHAKATEVLLTAKKFNAKEAYDVGLANRLLQEEACEKNKDLDEVGDYSTSTMKEALELAKTLISQHPVAMRSMVQTLRDSQHSCGKGSSLEITLRREAYAQAVCYARKDWGEGLNAVVQRRSPNFDDYNEL